MYADDNQFPRCLNDTDHPYWSNSKMLTMNVCVLTDELIFLLN